MFNRTRVPSYGQMAPGRDSAVPEEEGIPGRPPRSAINDAISGGMPIGNTPFAGAQTIQPPRPAQPAAYRPEPQYESAMDEMGRNGIGGGMGDPMGRASSYQAPRLQQPPASPVSGPSPTAGLPPPAGGIPPIAPPSRYGQAGSRIQDAYKQFLGRDASEEELGGQLGFGRAMADRNVFSSIGNIANSEEARQFAARPPVPTAPVAPPPGSEAPRSRNPTTSLMEGDPQKLVSAEAIAKSPKYQFLSQVQNYGRGEEGQLLAKLQADRPDFWSGWTFDGRGNFVYQGDPSKLNPVWNGVTRVDAFGGYNAGGPLRARWGADAPGQGAPMGGHPMSPPLAAAMPPPLADAIAGPQKDPRLAQIMAELAKQQRSPYGAIQRQDPRSFRGDM